MRYEYRVTSDSEMTMNDLKAAIKALTYSEMMEFAGAIFGADGPHEAAELLLEFCKGDLCHNPAARDAQMCVDPGPVPEGYILEYRNGEADLYNAFTWLASKQGYAYWEQYDATPYADLPDEPRTIIDAWCAELECK